MIRKKIPCAVLTFSTTTAAMSMEKKCGDYKISGTADPGSKRDHRRLRTCLENDSRRL